MKKILVFTLIILCTISCTIQKPSVPVGLYPKEQPKVPPPDSAAAQVPAGYRVEVLMKDLIWPTSIDFDEAGNAYVAEAGFVYGDPFAPAQILRITPGGQIPRYADHLMVLNLICHQVKTYSQSNCTYHE